jgi:tetratricopeptide (TPR) repeat protein
MNHWSKLALAGCVSVGFVATLFAAETTSQQLVQDGWQALSIGQYVEAIDLFDTAGASREVQLGLAIAQLNRPPVTPSSLAEAQRQLEALAGDDALGHAARYFLGRLQQIHPMRPDPAAAARDYEALVATGTDDTWCRLALVKLAILRLTVLRTPGALPEQLAAVEALLARTSDPATLHDLHLVMAEARLNHEIYDATTLGHLRAALATTRESDTMRADLLIQVGRLASMLGERDVAREHYARFLHDYPKERRNYTVSMALTHLDGPFPP